MVVPVVGAVVCDSEFSLENERSNSRMKSWLRNRRRGKEEARGVVVELGGFSGACGSRGGVQRGKD